MASNVIPAADDANPATGATASWAPSRRYAYYALTLLILANFFNYLDRHIVSVLAQSMKQDLALTDAQLGFLLGTAFATLYGVMGIGMGRIADQLIRTRVMTVGLSLWSAMTAVAGAASSFGGVAAARIGVGVGEAAANPCSHSLLSDYFPPRNRGMVLGAYLASVHLGIGGALIVGGLIVQKWSTMCTALPGGACDIAGWRAAFFIVGLPGLVLAGLIAMLREPPRPPAFHDGEPRPSAMRIIVREISTSIPPFTLFNLYALGGAKPLVKNLLLAALIFGAGIGVATLTGDWAQWIAVAVGVYSVTTWAQVLAMRDPTFFAMTFGNPTFNYAMFGGAALATFMAGVSTWGVPYAMRTLNANAAQVGLAFGLVTLVTAGGSTVLGGFIADRWKQRDRRAPVWIAMFATLAPVPLLIGMLNMTTLTGFLTCYAGFMLFASSWAGAFAALVQDMVQERMRGAAAAIFSMVMMITSAALGPYWTGKISTVTGSLATGMMALLVFVPIAFILLSMAAARLRTEKTMVG